MWLAGQYGDSEEWPEACGHEVMSNDTVWPDAHCLWPCAKTCAQTCARTYPETCP